MGNCTKCVNSRNHHEQNNYDNYDKQPDDTQILKDKDLPVYGFHTMIRKVKLKNLKPCNLYTLRFMIGQIEQLLLHEKNADPQGQIKWQIQEKFIFKCTQYELRKKFIQIQILNKHSIVQGSLKINFYLISVGPYHMDFQIKLPDSKDRARVSFDMKVSQVVNMKIQPESIQMFDVKQFVGDKYAYSLKTIIGNAPITQKLSYICEVSNDLKQKEQKRIKWNRKIDPEMPSIQNQIPFYEFHYATLKFIFWRMDQSNNIKRPIQVFGECYISFVKMLSFDSLLVTRNDRQYETKKVTLVQKLWNHGIQCGKIKIQMNFQIEKHIKQMLVCVRTQKGITRTSPVFKPLQAKSKSSCKQVTQIIQIGEKLTASEIGLEKKNATYYEKRSHFKNIQNSLKQLYDILQITNKQTMKFYNYVNEAELIKGQQIMLQLADRILGYMDQQYEVIETIKWKLLGLIVNRGQFSLNYLGFHSSQSKLKKELYNKKISNALKYQQFMYKLLGLTFNILGIKRYDEQRIFAQYFCAVAYFRVPQFRKKFLELITKKEDPQIKQWRGTEFSLYKNSGKFKQYLPGQNTFQILFDWQHYFYEHIQQQPKYPVNISYLEQLLKQQAWQDRICKRRGAFFAFIKQWVKYVQNISVRIVSSNWKHFPGYIDILRSFLVELKIKPVRQYPSSIKLACTSFLANQNLLNILITIIFKKTSVNNSLQVMKILQLINNFFSSLRERNKRIPSTFNYPFFFKGLKIIIQHQYSFTIAKALYIIYEHFQFFNYEFRIEVSQYLLGKIFFKLFLHWSNNIRIIFHHLLIIKIYKFFTEQQKIKTNTSAKTQILEISNRYNQLLIVLQSAKRMKQKQFIPSYQRDLITKLKRNMRNKMKNRNKGSNHKKQFFTNQSSICQKIQIQPQQPSRDIQEYMPFIDTKTHTKTILQVDNREPKRFDSQILSLDILQAIQQKTKIKKQNKREKVTRKIRDNGSRKQSCTESQTQINLHQSENYRHFGTLNTPEQIVMPILNEQDYNYVTFAMKQFTDISRLYLKSLKQLKQAPRIKPVLTLDSGEMRPDDYGEIQQW